MMRAIFENAECEEEHVLNYKCSIKGHQVWSRRKAKEHMMLYDDYFPPMRYSNPIYSVDPGCSNMCSNASTKVSGPMMISSSRRRMSLTALDYLVARSS